MIKLPDKNVNNIKNLNEGDIALLNFKNDGEHIVYIYRNNDKNISLNAISLSSIGYFWSNINIISYLEDTVVLKIFKTGETLTIA